MDLFDDLPEPVNNQAASEVPPEEVVLKKAEKRPHSRDEATPTKKVVLDEHAKLHGHCVERRGEREEMQDAHTLLDHFYTHNPLRLNLSLYGVFDGHGGRKASNYIADKMHHVIAAKFPKSVESLDKEMKKCLIEAFKVVDDDYLNVARRQRPSWKDGSTAVVVVCVEGVLYIANLGDSKAILCREDAQTGKLVAVALTTDHHPTNYEERMRIQKAGGFVRDGRVMGVLEVSRSIGDGPFKIHGVTCLPDIRRCSITPRDKFLVIACDGLWKTFDNDTAVQFINNILTDDQIQGSEYKSTEHVRLETACNRVANEAVRRLSADNVTVMLVAISHKNNNNTNNNNNNNNNMNNKNNNNEIKDDNTNLNNNTIINNNNNIGNDSIENNNNKRGEHDKNDDDNDDDDDDDDDDVPINTP